MFFFIQINPFSSWRTYFLAFFITNSSHLRSARVIKRLMTSPFFFFFVKALSFPPTRCSPFLAIFRPLSLLGAPPLISTCGAVVAQFLTLHSPGLWIWPAFLQMGTPPSFSPLHPQYAPTPLLAVAVSPTNSWCFFFMTRHPLVLFPLSFLYNPTVKANHPFCFCHDFNFPSAPPTSTTVFRSLGLQWIFPLPLQQPQNATPCPPSACLSPTFVLRSG